MGVPPIARPKGHQRFITGDLCLVLVAVDEPVVRIRHPDYLPTHRYRIFPQSISARLAGGPVDVSYNDRNVGEAFRRRQQLCACTEVRLYRLQHAYIVQLAGDADRGLSGRVESEVPRHGPGDDRDSIGVVGGLRIDRSHQLAPVTNEVRIFSPQHLWSLEHYWWPGLSRRR